MYEFLRQYRTIHGARLAWILFRQFAQKSLGKASALPPFFVQPDEKSCYAIRTPELCGIALKALFNDESGNPTALLFIAALENVLLDKSFL